MLQLNIYRIKNLVDTSFPLVIMLILKYRIASNYGPGIYLFLTRLQNETDDYYRKKHVLLIICDASDEL